MNDSLEQVGKMVREQSGGDARSREVIFGAKERFIESARERQAGGGSWFRSAWVLVGALGLVAALGGVWGLSQWGEFSNAPLEVALEERPVELIGHWIRSGEETKQLSFSDGTKLSLHPKTDLRVRQTTSSGATIDLGRGRTLAQIEPKKGATWRFQAGPFSVEVTGTEFDLAWDPEKRVLELALHQGSVLLSGPSVDGRRAVHKGEFVRVTLDSPQPEPASEEVVEPKEPGEASAEGDDAVVQDPSGGSRTATPDPWRIQLREGSPPAAVSAIEKAGASSVLSSASAQELWQVARVARLGGRPQLARDALLALRNKHGTRGQTSYLLGKVYADQLGATSEAIKWFETYLKEAPNGSLVEQAMGRVVELQAGSRAGKRAARRYLERFPSGSYAKFCRSQLR